MIKKYLILTEGFTDPNTAKTAKNLIHYNPECVVALLDSTQIGNSTSTLLGVAEDIPIVGKIDDAPGANTLLIGIAPAGGKIPGSWHNIILEAVKRGMNVISGLHEFISDNLEIMSVAKSYNALIWDIRKNTHQDVVHRKAVNGRCLRIQTVGNDCNVGKMVVSIELNNELKKRGIDSKFVATGQTGILLDGGGIPIDAVIGDYINGAGEKLVLDNQHHEVIVIEGQGSLVHPRYSSVTLGLLHGAQPHGLIMCYEMGREYIRGMDGFAIPDLKYIIDLYENFGSIMNPCKVIGVAVNSRKYGTQETNYEIDKLQERLHLPVCDVIKHGSGVLANAVEELKEVVFTTSIHS